MTAPPGLSSHGFDHHDGRFLLQLQRAAGNQAVVSWIAQRAVAVAAPPVAKAPSKPANARTILAERYPHLLSVLSTSQIAEIQHCIDAEFHIVQARSVGTPGYHESHEGWAGTTEGVEQHRRQMETEYHWGDVWERNHVVVVPTEKLLADDVLTGNDLKPAAPGAKGKADQLDAAYRDMLYTQLIEYPIRVTRERDKLGEDFTLDLFWGRIIEPMPHDGGLIRWRNLMDVQQFSMPYVLMLAKRINELDLEILKLRKAARGLPHLIYGQKVGELYGMVYNSSVKIGQELGEIGGYSDDEEGRAEIEHEATKHPAMARIIVRAPDGWLHLYALEPHTIKALVDLQNPWPSEEPPYVYLLNKGSNVTGAIVKIVTADTEELQVDPRGRGWRTKQDAAHLDTETQFAIGAILGDWAEDPTASQTMGQIVIGCIPIVGEVAAARDLIAGIHKMIETKGKEGKLETVMSLIGLLPFLHGILKAVAKKAKGGRVGAKVVNHALEEAAPRIQKELAETALHDPIKLEKMFPGIHAASGETKGLTAFSEHMSRAIKEGGTTAEEFARIAAQHFEELGKNAGDLVMLTKQRSWFEFMVALKQGGKGGEALMQAMNGWREAEVNALKTALAEESGRISEALGREVKAPHFGPTGSKGPLSDIDLSFTGTSASAQAAWAERYITNRIGASSFEEARKVLNLGIFTEAGRLHSFAGLGKGGAAVEKAMVREAELNVFAKMLREGASESELKAFAQNAGIKVPWEKVTQRADEIRKLAANPVLRHQKALELDALARRFEAAGKAEKPAIAADMAYKQALLNAAEKDAYVTPGGALKQVSMREGERIAMSAQMRYMDVLDQTQMLGHTLGEIHSLGVTPENAKALAKYTDRLVITAGQLKGVDIAAATARGAKAKQLFENAEMLLALARKDPANAAKAAGMLNDAQTLLSQLLTDIIKGSKEAEIAAAAADKEAATKAAHALEHQLELLGHGGHIGDAVVHNLGRGAGEGREAAE